MKHKQKLFFSLGMLMLSLAWVFSDVAASRNTVVQEGSRMARLLANNLPLMHLNKIEWNDELAARALDHFLESLDFEKVFFLGSDIDAFRAVANQLDDQVKRGELAFAHEVYDIFKQRVTNRVTFAKELLNEPFDFTTEEHYEWKRRQATWAPDEAAWDDLWRRRIKHQYLSRMINADFGSEDALEETEEERRSHSETINATLTPEEFVRRSLKRYQTVIKDNDETWVIERYLTAFAKAFDPHTDFMSPNNLEDFEINMKLSLQGIGAMLSNEDGAAKVERLIPGGPAEQDGRLKPGDKIIAVAQGDQEAVDVLHWPLYRTVRLIRGEKGSKVVLTVIPASDPGGTSVTTIDIIRDEVKLEEQAAKGDMRSVTDDEGQTKQIGVITLPDFYSDFKGGADGEARSCTRDVERILTDLLDQGAQGIVLDLRNNGGGSLSEAIDLTGLFIDTGPVVQVRDRRRVRALYDRDPRILYGGPLVVLVNRLSASASEIVAGALQDYGRAIIVGDSRTHGKGTVQTLTPLSSANPKLGSVKVTTASFYRIAGGSTQLRGVIPDIVIPSFMETMEVGEDQLVNALPYTTVPQMDYQTLRDTAPLVARLAEKSEARRAEDPRFQSFDHLLNRSRERQQAGSISLNLEERQALAAEEKELRKLIDEINPETGKKDDLILGEALFIVRDLIRIEKAEAVAGETTAPKPAAASL
ncbi:MAG TPA: carboxy terminal-processing peptidase [Kiritimatiellia bacterium]|nr:carboxy terminal-processing peptidase [Kiritimatiellia bacterium]HMO97830.1 carboxy terminal-processing peptidase [Kiritimatiellia bacterium]HMP96423.1 carboxy terminal-processing peptidase [Kiritimatiellia bacterium]